MKTNEFFFLFAFFFRLFLPRSHQAPKFFEEGHASLLFLFSLLFPLCVTRLFCKHRACGFGASLPGEKKTAALRRKSGIKSALISSPSSGSRLPNRGKK